MGYGAGAVEEFLEISVIIRTEIALSPSLLVYGRPSGSVRAFSLTGDFYWALFRRNSC